MADPYGSEEEQIQALKQWWSENGTSTIAGVVLAIAIVFGWKWWEAREATRAAQAASMYQQLQAAISGSAGDPVQRATAEHLATELANNYEGERYGNYAHLMLARLRVEANDLDSAAQELRLVIANTSDPAIKDLAKLRLARVLNAMGKPDEALSELEQTSSFEIEAQTLRGDVLRSRNDREGAVAAYRKAAEASGMGDKPVGMLALKIQELEAAPVGQPLPPVASVLMAQASAGENNDPAADAQTPSEPLEQTPPDVTVVVDQAETSGDVDSDDMDSGDVDSSDIESGEMNSGESTND